MLSQINIREGPPEFAAITESPRLLGSQHQVDEEILELRQ